ncbi:leucine-rich repeat domain-containing protein [Bifidobacterium sp. ESL0790]|uniref:leucine-rich repeat domain-containing protein n=1 Tax=Bifidobacterium sp. ESL0790 TaxID=2983233 RepID=UPI0023F647F4|nr:leucine-rich repeat domain-containing protein [Bifidobacterium sp. ESL0790]WEV72666.1 leucine-rich repeat domain-containing protein [Bifidobacterium sp. ESL0790]
MVVSGGLAISEQASERLAERMALRPPASGNVSKDGGTMVDGGGARQMWWRAVKAATVTLAALMALSIVLAPSLASAAAFDECVVGKSSIARCFPDKALAADVAEAVHADTGDALTQKMISDTKKLNAFGDLHGRIERLEGIGRLTNLTYLNIDRNALQSLKELTKLTKLETLYCNENEVFDFSPLSKLTSLRLLSLNNQSESYDQHSRGRKDTDLTPLKGLTGLTTLHLNQGKFKSIAPLAGLVNLQELDISEDEIADITPLAGMANLTWLNVSGNTLNSIDAVRGMPHLRELYAVERYSRGSSRISDISALETLTDMRKLDLEGSAIEDISPLRGMTNMRELWIGCNHISDIGPLAGMQSLTLLSIDYNQIQSVEALRGLTQLSKLDLRNNEISDISPLAGLTKLEGTLDISNNRISDISPLADCDHIAELDAEDNHISDISVLAKMRVLYEAHLGGNSVRDATLPAKARDIPGLGYQYTLLDDAAPDQLTLQTAKGLDGRYIKPKMYPESGQYDPTTGVVTWQSAGDADHISLTWDDGPSGGFAGTVVRHIQGVPPKQMHNVTFDVSRCSLDVPDQQVRDGDAANLPDVPMTCDGIGFGQWRVHEGEDDGYRKPEAFNRPVTKDMRLEGTWDESSGNAIDSTEHRQQVRHQGPFSDGPADEDEYVMVHLHLHEHEYDSWLDKAAGYGLLAVCIFAIVGVLAAVVGCVMMIVKRIKRRAAAKSEAGPVEGWPPDWPPAQYPGA